MKKMVLITLLAIVLLPILGQNPRWLSASRIGGGENDFGANLIIDHLGNQYMAGIFDTSITLGAFTLTASNASQDVFIGKKSSTGNWLWAIRAGGSDDDGGAGLLLDNDGYLYVSGNFAGTANFGATTLTSAGTRNMFLAKLDTNGNWQWAITAPCTGWTGGAAMALDTDDNLYLAGNFTQAMTFGSYTLVCNNAMDVYMAKYSPGGIWLWARKAAGNPDVNVFTMKIDASGNQYIAGMFNGSASFGTISLTSTNDMQDLFIAKMDANGNWLWALRAGGTMDDTAYSLCLDNETNLYVTGHFSGSADFGTHSVQSYGNVDIFVSKISSGGIVDWVVKAGGTGSDKGFDITQDISGNLWITGVFSNTAQFGTTTHTSYGAWDICIAKLDLSGNWLLSDRAGGSGYDDVSCIVAGNNGSMHISGYFGGTIGFGDFPVTSNGGFDIYHAIFGTTLAADDTYSTPTQSQLLSAYPNPFSQRTSISYSIKRASRAKMDVYNLKGQLIRNLLNRDLPNGEHTLSWDGKDNQDRVAVPGVYIIKFTADHCSETRKLILIK